MIKKYDYLEVKQLNSGKALPPKPPLDRILKEGAYHFCKVCGSSVSRNVFFGWFGEMLCDNRKCPNSKSKKKLT
jgi:hypothetical protein